jgi:regulator of sirC expression with transglutaminase-like and TPR domain
VDGHDILWRMNQNLARSWARRQSPEGVLRAIDRNRLLAPEDRQLAWQRCLVLGEAGHSAEAIAATEDWLITAEDPASVQKASVLLTMLRGKRPRRSVE